MQSCTRDVPNSCSGVIELHLSSVLLTKSHLPFVPSWLKWKKDPDCYSGTDNVGRTCLCVSEGHTFGYKFFSVLKIKYTHLTFNKGFGYFSVHVKCPFVPF